MIILEDDFLFKVVIESNFMNISLERAFVHDGQHTNKKPKQHPHINNQK
jgi:hypothetical protein